jgi:hypothetical protein
VALAAKAHTLDGARPRSTSRWTMTWDRLGCYQKKQHTPWRGC